jgi:hypothetical protein
VRKPGQVLVGAWVTPIDPEIEAEPPMEVLQFDVLAPGILDTERDVASFVLVNYSGRGGVSGKPGCYIDMAFPFRRDPDTNKERAIRELSWTRPSRRGAGPMTISPS